MPAPGGRNYAARAILWATPVPTPAIFAARAMPMPSASSARTAASFSWLTRARPMGLPLFVPLTRGLAIPAFDPLDQNGALELCEYARHLEERSRPLGVLVSSPCWCR